MSATVRQTRRPAGKRRLLMLVIGVLILLVAVVVVVVMAGRSPERSPARPGVISAARLAEDRALALQVVNTYKSRSGIWMPAQYASQDWEKYEDAAAADAALGLLPGGNPAQAQAAARTVDAAIADHQLRSGDFDNGTAASGPSGVNGGFWAEAEGLIALTLRHAVTPQRLSAWEQSMARYVAFLESSHNASWYANGNVVLRQAVVMLETYDLARSVSDPAAPQFLRDYQAERQFLVNPSAARAGGISGWATYGEHSGANGARWFAESPTSSPHAPITCANGRSPCNGFDPNYAAAQLHDAIIAYTVGGDQTFWSDVIRGEYVALQPRIRGGELNAARGSRDNIPTEVFYPPVYALLESQDDRKYDTAWSEQLDALDRQLSAYEKEVDPGGNAYSLLLALSIPLIQAYHLGGLPSS
jgi:hypothetical protein